MCAWGVICACVHMITVCSCVCEYVRGLDNRCDSCVGTCVGLTIGAIVVWVRAWA
jgi:hypothetical protein